MVYIFVQKEIFVAIDIVALLYKETTLVEERSALGIWLAMTKAQQKMVKLIKTRNFDKYIAVANPKNGNAIFDEIPYLSCVSTLDLSSLEMIFLHHLPFNLCFTQINNHYSVNINLDMTIEKLQKVATACVKVEYKARWLQW